jgi:hypothetical protein
MSVNKLTAQIRFHHILSQKKLDKYGFVLVGDSEHLIEMCTSRKVNLSVSNGSINVDVWRIIDNTNCENGLDKNTSIDKKLQIRDNRKKYGDATKVLVLPFKTWTYGLNSIPFRYRGSEKNNANEIPSTVTSSFQLAVNFGRTYGLSQITSRGITSWSVTGGLFFGPSSAELKKETVQDPSMWTTNQTNPTLTYGLNIILARNNFGLVFAYGFDNALGKNSDKWIYDNKPWFGFGVNTSFLK